MKAIIFIGLLAIVLACGCTAPNIAPAPNFVTNASHGMEFTMEPGDVILVGRAGYHKIINWDSYEVVLCEECGTSNDCLKNNLNRIKAYNDTRVSEDFINNVRSMNQSNLVFFYVYPITYDDVKSQQGNETFADAYTKVFDQKCNNPYYTNLIGEMIK